MPWKESSTTLGWLTGPVEYSPISTGAGHCFHGYICHMTWELLKRYPSPLKKTGFAILMTAISKDLDDKQMMKRNPHVHHLLYIYVYDAIYDTLSKNGNSSNSSGFSTAFLQQYGSMFTSNGPLRCQ